MQLFMKTCVVAVFLKKKRGMYVPGTAIDVCIVLTLLYYKFSIKIWGKQPPTQGFLSRNNVKEKYVFKKKRALMLLFHHCAVLFFSVIIPKWTGLSFPAKTCFYKITY